MKDEPGRPEFQATAAQAFTGEVAVHAATGRHFGLVGAEQAAG